jgi:D-alanyl-lipoteichoic acid acyltransferase DltB (MBOAT superfamily)
MVFPLFSLARSPQSTLSVVKTIFFASYITVFLAQTWHAVSAKKMFVLSMLVDQITSLLYFACKVVLFVASLHHFPFLQVEIMFDVLQNPVPNFEQISVFVTNTSSKIPKIPRTRSHFLQATSATFSKVARPASTMIPTWPCRAAMVPEDQDAHQKKEYKVLI